MNSKFFVFALICALPWLYLGIVKFGNFKGDLSVYMIWFALWEFRRQVLLTPTERKAIVSKDEPYWKMPLYILTIVPLFFIAVGIFLFFGYLEYNFGKMFIDFILILFLIFILLYDIKKAYIRSQM